MIQLQQMAQSWLSSVNNLIAMISKLPPQASLWWRAIHLSHLMAIWKLSCNKLAKVLQVFNVTHTATGFQCMQLCIEFEFGYYLFMDYFTYLNGIMFLLIREVCCRWPKGGAAYKILIIKITCYVIYQTFHPRVLSVLAYNVT